MDISEPFQPNHRQDGAFAEAGRRGGETVKERYGTPFYKEIGRKGGETVRNERGHEFYEEIGRKGGQKVRELINEGKRLNAIKKPE